VNNPELGFPAYITVLERDIYIHQAELLKLASLVAFEEGKVKPASENSPREYIYLLMDAAAEAGYVLDHVEAVDLLDSGRDELSKENERWRRIMQRTQKFQ
jgi:hypothetical protein